MYTFTDLGLIILFATVMTGAYFIYERAIRWPYFSLLSVRSYVLNTTTGIFYGLMTTLMMLIFKSISRGSLIPIFIITPIALLIFKNITVSASSLFAPFLYYSIALGSFDISMLLISVYSITAIVYTFVKFYLSANIAQLVLISTLSLLGLISLFIISYAFDYGFERVAFESSIFVPIFTFIVFVVLRTAIRFSDSANLLFDTVNYVYGLYLRHPLASEAAGILIKENKVKNALFGLIDIEVKDEDEETVEEVRNTILDNLQAWAGEESVLFNYDENKYGFLIPIKMAIDIKESIEGNKLTARNSDDFLNPFSKFIQSMNATYITTKVKHVEAKVKSGVAVYGIQSNSINDLESYSIFALDRLDDRKGQQVSIYDKKLYSKLRNDSMVTGLLDDYTKLDEFNVEYTPVFNINNTEEFLNVVNVNNINDFEFFQSYIEILESNGWINVFDRFFANEITASKHKGKVMLRYQPINEGINEQEFINKLEERKINHEDFIWIVKNDYKSDIKQLNLATYFEEDVKYNNQIKYVIIRNLPEKLDTDKTTIFADALQEQDVNDAMKLGVDYIGGGMLEINSSAKKPNKQSKIYIEELITLFKGEKNE